MEEGLEKKTGKPLSYWIEVVKSSGLEKHSAIMTLLKTEHGFTHGFANFVALKARKADAGSHDENELLGKEDLKPIYFKLKQQIDGLGADVTITPKKDSVSFIRKRQFVLIKPATKTRIDLGLKLKGVDVTNRLENSGPFGSMCTHRVRITSLEEVDDELMDWIKDAYERSV